LAGYFGVENIIRLLIDRDRPDMENSHSRTPLSYATEKGHKAVIKLLLLTRGQAEVGSKSKHGKMPLSYAAWNRH